MLKQKYLSYLHLPFISSLAFLAFLFLASDPAKGLDLRSFSTQIKTGAVEVAPQDQISLQISNIAGHQDIEFRVYFLDETGTRLPDQPQNQFELLESKHSSATSIQVSSPSSSGHFESPSMVRAVISVRGGCGPGTPSSFIIHGTHTAASTGNIDHFSACPLVVCTGKSDDDPPVYQISGHCGVHRN